MILTVTLNPLLEKRLFFSTAELGKSNRAYKEIYAAGGKGINVSRQLNFLKMQNHALTFIGGGSGKKLRHILDEEKINASYVSTKNETRSAAVIIEEEQKRITTFFGTTKEALKSEADEFKSKMEKMIANSSIVVFSGSSLSKETDDIFSFGINKANELDKTSIVDTYGEALKKAIEASPTVLHNNFSEIRSTFDAALNGEKEIVQFLNYLYSKNIKLAFLTDGKNPAYASKYDFIYKAVTPVVENADSTGSGDAFTAGVAFGLEKSLVFDEIFLNALALGADNASKFEVCNSSIEEMEKFKSGISINAVGKKMKLINDSPDP